MHFIFLQPELKSKTTSHFYQYIQALRTALEKLGNTANVIGSAQLNDSPNDTDGVRFKNRRQKGTGPVAVLLGMITGNFSAYGEFKTILGQLAQKDREAVFFVDTILNDRVIGLALAYSSISRKFPATKLVVVFRFTYRSNSRILTWIQTSLHRLFCFLQKKNLREQRTILLTDSDLLQKMYQKNIPATTHLLPIPLKMGEYKAISELKQTRHQGIVIGFLGGKAAYKGLVDYLRAIASIGTQGIRYLVHGVDTVNQLLQLAESNLSKDQYNALVEKKDTIDTYGQLNDKEYMLLFQKMDLIMIPYSSLQFAEGTSNIFAEAMAAGVVPLVPANTWMASQLTELGLVELVINLNDTHGIALKTEKAITNFAAITRKMKPGTASWQSYHNSDVFAKHLVGLIS